MFFQGDFGLRTQLHSLGISCHHPRWKNRYRIHSYKKNGAKDIDLLNSYWSFLGFLHKSDINTNSHLNVFFSFFCLNLTHTHTQRIDMRFEGLCCSWSWSTEKSRWTPSNAAAPHTVDDILDITASEVRNTWSHQLIGILSHMNQWFIQFYPIILYDFYTSQAVQVMLGTCVWLNALHVNAGRFKSWGNHLKHLPFFLTLCVKCILCIMLCRYIYCITLFTYHIHAFDIMIHILYTYIYTYIIYT